MEEELLFSNKEIRSSKMLILNEKDSEIVKSAKTFANTCVYNADRETLYACYMSGVIEAKEILQQFVKKRKLDKDENVNKLLEQLKIKYNNEY